MIERVVLGAACAGLALLAGAMYLRASAAKSAEQRIRVTLATERAERAQEREKLTAEALASSEAARAVEARWREKQTEVQAHAQTQIRSAQAAAARARDAADSLQQRAEAIARQCANPQRDGAGAAPGSAAAADPGTVLANVLRGLAASAAELAAVADARGVAGVACERAYDSITTAPQPTR